VFYFGFTLKNEVRKMFESISVKVDQLNEIIKATITTFWTLPAHPSGNYVILPETL